MLVRSVALAGDNSEREGYEREECEKLHVLKFEYAAAKLAHMYAQSFGKVSNETSPENIVEVTRASRFAVSSRAKITAR